MSLYSVYDRVAEEYSAPNMAKNDGTAFRQFMELMTKVPEYSKEEYWLMKVGEFDSETGQLVAVDKPIRIERSINE